MYTLAGYSRKENFLLWRLRMSQFLRGQLDAALQKTGAQQRQQLVLIELFRKVNAAREKRLSLVCTRLGGGHSLLTRAKFTLSPGVTQQRADLRHTTHEDVVVIKRALPWKALGRLAPPRRPREMMTAILYITPYTCSTRPGTDCSPGALRRGPATAKCALLANPIALF